MKNPASPSSSSNRPAPPPAGVEAAKPVVFIDWGPALPESYGQPRILALVRDPRCFFACWEEGDTLRARDLSDGSVQEQSVGWVGAWYFEGIPEHEYEVELLSGGRHVAVSGRILLPRLDPATDVDPEWAPTPEQEELLRAVRGTLEPFVQEIDDRSNSGGWRRRIAGMPVSRPSRTS